jgi:hypothetical protein
LSGRPGVGNESNLTRKGRGWTAEQRRKAAETRKANRDGQAVATKLISDPQYRKNLKKRLREGSAGPIENLLWMLAYGKPKERSDGEDYQVRVALVREAAKKAIKESKPRFALPKGPVIDVEVEPTEKAGGNGGP